MRQTHVFRPFRRAFLVFFALATPALAHPHVLVTARSAVMIDAGGKLTGIRHSWTFDEAYSAFATTGMKRGGDGKIQKKELEDLSKLNVESLKEFGYFTSLKQGKLKHEFDDPQPGYYLEDEGKALTLHFVLPLKTPVAPVNGMALRVDDESLFVAFSFAEKNPVTIEGTATKCTVDLKRPKKSADSGDMTKLGEDFFNNMSAGFADQYATTVRLACP